MIDTGKIEHTVRSFFDAFSKLSAQERLYFITEIDKTLQTKNEQEKQIFLTLIKCAREGKNYEEAIKLLGKG